MGAVAIVPPARRKMQVFRAQKVTLRTSLQNAERKCKAGSTDRIWQERMRAHSGVGTGLSSGSDFSDASEKCSTSAVRRTCRTTSGPFVARRQIGTGRRAEWALWVKSARRLDFDAFGTNAAYISHPGAHHAPGEPLHPEAFQQDDGVRSHSFTSHKREFCNRHDWA